MFLEKQGTCGRETYYQRAIEGRRHGKVGGLCRFPPLWVHEEDSEDSPKLLPIQSEEGSDEETQR
jgi:hypothetical protein